ncbi:hypothetical protein [Corallococcus sp. AB011P]|uniref:hypothetical protein n=1 Tax=Corallococcus sp. AB011P TaxID=2316735 RepID=UPI0013155DC3|nr:hypothetical protein [Corallococcus sp. AB011P]
MTTIHCNGSRPVEPRAQDRVEDQAGPRQPTRNERARPGENRDAFQPAAVTPSA